MYGMHHSGGKKKGGISLIIKWFCSHFTGYCSSGETFLPGLFILSTFLEESLRDFNRLGSTIKLSWIFHESHWPKHSGRYGYRTVSIEYKKNAIDVRCWGGHWGLWGRLIWCSQTGLKVAGTVQFDIIFSHTQPLYHSPIYPLIINSELAGPHLTCLNIAIIKYMGFLHSLLLLFLPSDGVLSAGIWVGSSVLHCWLANKLTHGTLRP